MSDIRFEVWLDEVVPHIVGAEIPFILRHIRHAAIDFCEQSLAWQLESLPIDIIQGDEDYPLLTGLDPLRTELVQITNVSIEGKTIDPTSWTALRGSYDNPLQQTGKPFNYLQDYVDSLTLFPKPNSNITGGLTYKAALRPSRVAEAMDGSTGQKYFNAITDGALAKLFAIPNKPWSDGQNAVFRERKFNLAAQSARDAVVSGHGRGARRTKTVY